jgi:hypothetical protein
MISFNYYKVKVKLIQQTTHIVFLKCIYTYLNIYAQILDNLAQILYN